MSQPCQCHKQQGCGDPQDSGMGAGDHSLCHARASGPRSLLLMLSLLTIHPFPQIPCSHPIQAAFCSTNTHLGPQEGPQGATTLRAPHNPGVGGSFLPSPASAEGQGCSSVSFPAVGFLSGELRAVFAPPNCRGWGWRLSMTGNHIPAPTQASNRVGKRPTSWEHEEQREVPGPNPRAGRQSLAFFVHFPGVLQHTEQPKKVRAAGLWGVNTKGMDTGAPHTLPQQPRMLPPLPPALP